MSRLVTTQATLTPQQLNEMFKKMDHLAFGYHFTSTEERGAQVLECWSEGAPYCSLQIVLRPDGTWTALVDVVVGTEERP
jgi:hypothetical protein